MSMQKTANLKVLCSTREESKDVKVIVTRYARSGSRAANAAAGEGSFLLGSFSLLTPLLVCSPISSVEATLAKLFYTSATGWGLYQTMSSPVGRERWLDSRQVSRALLDPLATLTCAVAVGVVVSSH